jgi:hypothetical protein
VSSRGHLTLKRKLASALLQMLRPDESGKLVPVIPYEDAKLMTDDQIISLFHFDHGILHAHDGPDEAWNLTPRPIIEHRVKTATKDVPAIAKGRNITKREEEFRRRILAKDAGESVERKTRWPKRPFPKRERASR